jgi:DNA-binding PadR family transcriptional regulator
MAVIADAVDRSWMRGSPLKGVLLGLVAELEQPTHAYVLAAMMARRLGPAWQVDRKGVYQMLSQLQSANLISSEPSLTRRGVLDVYFPTEHTEAALAVWMETQASKSPVREELQAKVAVSRSKDVPSLLRALDAYERECFDMLKATTEAEVATGSWSGLAMALARIAADEHLQAELRWVMTARQAIQEFMAQSRR